jgi:RES domain-containing protein
LIQEDWAVFSEKLLGSGRVGTLLREILNSDWDDDSGNPPYRERDLYSRYRALGMLDTWEDFCRNVRQDLEATAHFSDIFDEDLHRYGKDIDTRAVLYRARRGYASVDQDGRKRPYAGLDIGAPPEGKRGAGRGNVSGRAVLYCSDREETAIAEKRPAVGLCLSVARVTLKAATRILDLNGAIPDPNPFAEESLNYWVEFSALMRAFARELSTPLERDDNVESDYLPCQRLAQWIEAAGFRGIRYPSAVNPGGANIVLFYPEDGQIGASRLVKITDVSIRFEHVGS